MTREPTRLVDPKRVQHRRRELGLTAALVAKATRVEAAVINRLETGSDQAGLTAGFLLDLCKILGVELNDLRPEPTPTSCPEPGVDARRLGSVLQRCTSWTPVAGLASALEWTLPRTLLALVELEEALAPAGQSLAWLGEHDVLVVADGGNEEVVASLEMAVIADQGLNRLQALILSRTIREATPWRSTNERLHGHRLVDLGLIQLDDAGIASLTDLARYNLCLEQAP